jgi:hypothetical protein
MLIKVHKSCPLVGELLEDLRGAVSGPHCCLYVTLRRLAKKCLLGAAPWPCRNPAHRPLSNAGQVDQYGGHQATKCTAHDTMRTDIASCGLDFSVGGGRIGVHGGADQI